MKKSVAGSHRSRMAGSPLPLYLTPGRRVLAGGGSPTTLTFPDADMDNHMEITEGDEIRFERLYEIIREYPRGAAAPFIENKYNQKFGETLEKGWFSSLPEEFEVDDKFPSLVTIYPAQPRPIVKQAHFKIPTSVVDQHPIELVNQLPVELDQRSDAQLVDQHSDAQLVDQHSVAELVDQHPLVHFKSDTSLVDQHSISISSVNGDEEPPIWNKRLDQAFMTAKEMCEQLKSVELPMERRINIMMSHCCINNNELNIFVRSSEEEEKYEKMIEEMNINYGDGTEKGGTDARINIQFEIEDIVDAGLYVVRYNDQWNRGVAFLIHGDQSISIEMYLLDTAEYIIPEITDIRRITLDLLDYPIFCVRCQLADVDVMPDIEMIQSQIQHEQNDYFSAQIISKQEPKSGGSLIHFIQLFDIFGQNLNQKFKSKVLSPMQASTPLSSKMADSPVSTSTPVGANETFTLPSAEPDVIVLDSDVDMPSSSENGIEILQPLLPMEIPNSPEFGAVVVFAPDPTEFSIQLKAIQPLPDYIKQLTETEDFLSKPVLESEPKPGHNYVAKVEEQWHRVYVSEKAKLKGSGKYRVFLVDLGQFAFVHLNEMKDMTQALFAANMMAVKCELVGIKPPPPSRRWSGEAESAFSRRVIDECPNGVIIQKVGHIESWKKDYGPALPKVNATVMDASTKEDIGQWLIDQGYAVPI